MMMIMTIRVDKRRGEMRVEGTGKERKWGVLTDYILLGKKN
jgi:hypothetical protein